MYYINIRQKVLALSIGALLGVNSTTALTAEYGPLEGNNLVLQNGDIVRVDGNQVTTPNLTGIDSTTQGGGVTINGAAIIDINSNDNRIVEGINLANGATNDLGSGTEINITQANQGSNFGLRVGKQTNVNADNLNITINKPLSDMESHGIYVSDQSDVDLGQGGQIDIHNGGTGIKIYGGTVTANGISINTGIDSNSSLNAVDIQNGTLDLGQNSSISINAKGSDGSAILLAPFGSNGSPSTVTASQLSIWANNAYGVKIQGGNKADLGSGSYIELTNSENFAGVWAVDSGAEFTADNITIKSDGLGAGIRAGYGGKIDIGANSHIITQAGEGVVASGTDNSTINFIGEEGNRNSVTTTSGYAVAVRGTGNVINLENTDVTVDYKGSGVSVGLFTSAGVLNAKNTIINAAESVYAVAAMNGGTINLTGTTVINAGSNISSALTTQGTNAIVNLTGNAIVNGNIYSTGNNSLIDINLDAGSAITGKALINGTAKTNLAMTDSTWNMTDSSTVTNLTLNNSTVNFANTGTTNRANNFTTLTTDSLQGNGLFNINTDIVGQTGDQIIVNGTAAGNHQLNIANSGSAATDGTETLTVVTTGSNQANFSLANKVELGAYEYGLRASPDEANNVELFSVGQRAFTTTAQAASSFLNIGYLTNYIENQTMLQRLGDLRNSQAMGANTGGLWMKGFGGKLSSFAGNSSAGFEMNYTGTQAGIDKVLDVNEGNLVIGAMAGYTRTNPNYRGGDGNGKNYTAGLYATYFLDNGFYVDTVLKYNSMRNHFNVKDSAGTAVKGTGKTQGVSVSTEIGKRFWLAENNSGLYLEPQAQLSYGYQSGDTVSSSNGLKVGLSHYNSTLGRVGAVLGYQIQGDNPLNVYLKSGVVREMSGGASFKFNDGNKHNHSFRSNWFDNGIGITMNINKKHNIYAEFDYAKGNNFDKRQLDVGYRYSF